MNQDKLAPSEYPPFQILRPFFEGPWTDWVNLDRFLNVAKNNELEVKKEQTGEYSPVYSLKFGNTTTILDVQNQMIHLETGYHTFSMEIRARETGHGIGVIYYFNKRGNRYYEVALNPDEKYLNDIREILTLDKDIPVIKKLVAQLLA